MAGLLEQAQWDAEIYQIEQTDPVVGGPPDLAQGQGITNVPHQALANRTAWLKAQVDALNALLIGGLDQYATDAELAAAIVAMTAQVDGKLDATAYTAADVLLKLLTVDGAGCGPAGRRGCRLLPKCRQPQ